MTVADSNFRSRVRPEGDDASASFDETLLIEHDAGSVAGAMTDALSPDGETTAQSVRDEQNRCRECGTRLSRRGRSLVCTRCDRITREFAAEDLVEVQSSVASSWANALVGRRMGNFRIERLLGEGAAGAVFLARHRDLRRRSAVKVLSPAQTSYDGSGVRFLDEARHASSLCHPNVVTTHSVGEDHVGSLGTFRWIEQEYVAGRSLGDYLDRWTLQPSEAARLLVDIASGLAAAHRRGLLHRDIKPDNILLTHNRTAKLGDFGLARPVEGAAGQRSRLVGTPNFMAPEVFAGDEPSTASDVYSLGITFFTMLTGEPPFARRCSGLDELSAAVRTQSLPSVRRLRDDVSLEMAECLAQLTDRSASNRPTDGIAALQLVEALLGHVRDLETLIREAVRDEPSIDWRRIPIESGDRYELDVSLPGGRSQTVYLEESDGPYSQRNVVMDSVCGPVDHDHLERMLRLNATVSHGAIAIKDRDGVESFVMVDTYPRGTLDAEEVRRSVWELAVYADQMELLLTGGDCN